MEGGLDGQDSIKHSTIAFSQNCMLIVLSFGAMQICLDSVQSTQFAERCPPYLLYSIWMYVLIQHHCISPILWQD